MHCTSHWAWLCLQESWGAITEREDVNFEKMKKAKLGKAPSPTAVSSQGLPHPMLSQGVRLTLLSRSMHTSPAVMVGMARLMLHSGEPAGCLLSLEQRPVNPWTRSTWGLSKEASTACPKQQVCAVVVEGRWCGHLILMCCLASLNTFATCLAAHRNPFAAGETTAWQPPWTACWAMPVSPKERGNHLSTLASWLHAEEKQCARAAIQLCRTPAWSQRSPSWHPTRGGSWTNLPFLLLPSLPPQQSSVPLPASCTPTWNRGRLPKSAACWPLLVATREPVSTSCGWLLC